VRKIHLASALLALLSAAFVVRTSAMQDTITQQELARRTQDMFDAVVPGNQEPFKKYYADDAFFFDEKGRDMAKAALVKDITPLPAGYSGSIKMKNIKSHIEGDVAIMSYDLDESETIFGQALSARYHETDTWMQRKGQWQIVATQVLRYYEDPAAGKADTAMFPQYAGEYELAPGNRMTISSEGDQLYSKRGDRAKELLIPEAADIFFRKGVEGRRLFRYDAHGKVDALIDRRNNEDVIWKKVTTTQ
jgi:ketosteroid isomerase-like protein